MNDALILSLTAAVFIVPGAMLQIGKFNKNTSDHLDYGRLFIITVVSLLLVAGLWLVIEARVGGNIPGQMETEISKAYFKRQTEYFTQIYGFLSPFLIGLLMEWMVLTQLKTSFRQSIMMVLGGLLSGGLVASIVFFSLKKIGF